MSREAESVSLKLGVDGSQVEPEMQKFKQRVTSGLGESKQWFEKAGSEGRSFKKVLNEITEQSPIMGSALKFAISPVVGMLAAVTLGFAYAKGKIDEFNKSLDEMRDKNAKAFGASASEKAKAVADRVDSIEEKYKKFYEGLKDKENPVVKALLKEQETRDSVHKLAKELRDDEYEHAKRKIEDAARLEKEVAEDNFKFREKYASVHGASAQYKYNLGEEKTGVMQGIEDRQREATRALEDKHKQQERAAIEKSDQEKRASLERAQKTLQSEADAKDVEIQNKKDAMEGNAAIDEATFTNATKQKGILEARNAEIKGKLPGIIEKQNQKDVTGGNTGAEQAGGAIKDIFKALGRAWDNPENKHASQNIKDFLKEVFLAKKPEPQKEQNEAQKLQAELKANESRLKETELAISRHGKGTKYDNDELDRLMKQREKINSSQSDIQKQLDKIPVSQGGTKKPLKYGDEGYVEGKDAELAAKFAKQQSGIDYKLMTPAQRKAFNNTAKLEEPVDKRTLDQKFSDMAASLKELETLAKGNGLKTTVDIKE